MSADMAGRIARMYAWTIVALRVPIVLAWIAALIASFVLLPWLGGSSSAPLDDIVPSNSPRRSRPRSAPLSSSARRSRPTRCWSTAIRRGLTRPLRRSARAPGAGGVARRCARAQGRSHGAADRQPVGPRRALARAADGGADVPVPRSRPQPARARTARAPLRGGATARELRARRARSPAPGPRASRSSARSTACCPGSRSRRSR